MKKFLRTVDLKNRQAMISFLSGHSRYFLNEENKKFTSYANNVSAEVLGLDKDVDRIYATIVASESFRDHLEEYFDYFSEMYGCAWHARFGGEKDEYLVLCPQRDMPVDVGEFFEDWDTDSLRERVQLVQDFDRLCDFVVKHTMGLADTFLDQRTKAYAAQVRQNLKDGLCDFAV